MNKIHLLSKELVGIIAAGEIIERPASVVKELIENSIDAGATEIKVFTKHAGIEEIKVVDNGSGIEKDQLELSITPHATSKVNKVNDIFKLQTLGFRGEALASIAQVSKFTIESQTKTGLGAMITCEGSQGIKIKDISSREGTTVIVQDLFFNTPVRLKYLKKISTELNHVIEIVQRIALSRPDISFSLYEKGRELFRTIGNGDLRQTVAKIFGLKLARNLIEVKASDDDFKIEGLISLPDETRANRRNIDFSVNHRVVKSIDLTKFLLAGYQTKLMVGRFPTAIIDIELDPRLIDVNIHPTKQELKISKLEQLGALLQEGVRSSLQNLDLISKADLHHKKEMQNHFEEASHQAVNYFSNMKEEPLTSIKESKSLNNDFDVAKPDKADFSDIKVYTPGKSNMKEWDQFFAQEKPMAAFVDNKAPTAVKESIDNNLFINKSSNDRFPHLEYVGQIEGTYLIANSDQGFYIIDQHAAQERVNFEYYREVLGSVKQEEQTLLVPIVLDYTKNDYLEIKEKAELLNSLGLHLQDFGDNSFIVNSYPAWIKKDQVKDTIKELIDFILNDPKTTLQDFRLKTAKMMSCKRAIKAHHFISDQEAITLIHQLSKLENPFNCPHGRPVLVLISNHDLDKMFKRVQDPHLHDLDLSDQ